MSYIKNIVQNIYWGDFNCEMCGECCRSGYNVHVNKGDVEKWKKLNKQFLLEYIIINPKTISETNDAILISKEHKKTFQNPESEPILIPKSFNALLKGLDIGLEYIIKSDISGKCPFLHINRCSIHIFKPMGCNLFPYKIHDCFSY
jgi:Fe-S-cluster containining protein